MFNEGTNDGTTDIVAAMAAVLSNVSAACPGTPIVGIGGIRSLADALEFFIVGACAVQVGTTNYLDPDFLNRFPGELNTWLDQEKLSSLTELVGSVRV